MGPLLDVGVKKIGGQCLRTWHFAKPIIDIGYNVKLVTIPIPDKDRSSAEKKLFLEKKYSNFPYIEFQQNNPFVVLPELQRIHDEFFPDVLLGVNTFPSYMVCSLKSMKPIWVDLNGWCMVEGQTKAYLDKNDSILQYFWKLERRICLRADKFSTVSEPQAIALIGELAATGRLNSYTFNYNFATSIPNAVNELHFNFSPVNNKKMLRGIKVPDNAFILLWSGGFNTWTDIDALSAIIESFLKYNKNRYFVSTGGMVDGHDEKTYLRFLNKIEQMENRDRCIIEGWIETEKMLHYYAESDLGINIDSENYETQFGARNRLTNMLASGLPVITTKGPEISSMIDRAGVGWAVPIGNTTTFILKLNALAEHPEQLKIISKKAKAWAAEEFSYQKTTQRLAKWLKNPSLSPDNAVRFKKVQDISEMFNCPINPIDKENFINENFNVDELIAAQRDLNILRSKPLFKLLHSIKKIFKK